MTLYLLAVENRKPRIVREFPDTWDGERIAVREQNDLEEERIRRGVPSSEMYYVVRNEDDIMGLVQRALAARAWRLGDPCPYCDAKDRIKFNGGNPLCLACGRSVDSAHSRLVLGATQDADGRLRVTSPVPPVPTAEPAEPAREPEDAGEPPSEPARPRRRTKTVEGVTLVSRGDRYWESEDERYVVSYDDDFETECDAPHPVKISRAARARYASLPDWDKRNVQPHEKRWALLEGKRGYYCPGGEVHYYGLWVVSAGNDVILRCDHFDEALDALGEYLRTGKTWE